MASNDLALRQFLRLLRNEFRGDAALAKTEQILDKWAIIVCQAIHFERHDLVELAIKLLHEAYSALPASGAELTEKRLAVVVRLYAIGGLAIRVGDWETLRTIILRPAKIHPADNSYVHSSWIRHGHVEAARAGLTEDEETGAYLISESRRLVVARAAMRPDLAADPVSSISNSASDDAVLNSLCQFDILYCLLVVAEGQTSVKSMYPSSAAFDEGRADPILVAIAGDRAIRATLFSSCTDQAVAEAIYNVVRLTMQEALKFGGRWWGPPPSVQEFLTTQGQEAL